MRYHRYGMGAKAVVRRRTTGMGLALAGSVIVIKVFPLWIWPVIVGLWIFLAGMVPVLVGMGLIWIGWRFLSGW